MVLSQREQFVGFEVGAWHKAAQRTQFLRPIERFNARRHYADFVRDFSEIRYDIVLYYELFNGYAYFRKSLNGHTGLHVLVNRLDIPQTEKRVPIQNSTHLTLLGRSPRSGQ